MSIIFTVPLVIFFGFYNFSIFMFFLMFLMFLFFLLISHSFFMVFSFFNLISWSLILLTIFVVSMMIISNLSFSLDFLYGKEFNFLLSLLFLFLCFLFFSMNFFLFYIFFEFSIIPIFFLLCGWGYNFERLQAGFYMFLYTLFFSLPFLIFICFLFFDLKTVCFFSSYFLYFSTLDLFFVFFSFFMFFVKLPSFFFHLWLPKAHVEAPVSGSMILAGILLKLGAYGLILHLSFVFFYCFVFMDFFFMLGFYGGLMSSFICFFQVDLKKLVAFMSVFHMSMVLSSIFTFNFFSYVGVIMMLVSHGLSSSGLFYGLGCLYERLFSRSIILIKGNITIFVMLGLWFFLLISFNVSVPPSLNFFSELSMFFGVMFFGWIYIFFFLFMVFWGVLCSIHLYVSMFHGVGFFFVSFHSLSLKENMILFYHCFPLIVLFIFF